jgi:hypothetical protein
LRGTHSESPLPPAGGSRGALRVLDALNRWYQSPPADDLGLDVALQNAARISKPGSRVVAVIDPRSVDQLADGRLAALSAHQDAIAVLLVDPLELAPPQARVAFAGAQSNWSRRPPRARCMPSASASIRPVPAAWAGACCRRTDESRIGC